jgi:Na+-translocating ferredoxin:NAD+ oxidoreductase RnfD subunit
MSTTTPERNGAAPPTSQPGPKPGKVLGIDHRFLAPILITCILAVGQYQYQVLEWYGIPTALAILSSLALELILGRIATGRWPHLASAYISGISVGIIIRSTSVWPYILCALLSISSKYALRVHGRHLFNPSNLGVSLMLLLWPAAVAPLSQQWGNDWPVLLIIWVLGCMILYRLGRLHITLTYVAAFVALSLLRSAVSGERWVNEIAPLTSPVYQLFIFFMITDPKTTTRTWARQCAVAVLVAVVETTLRIVFGVYFTEYSQFAIHAPYYALFVVAPVTNLAEIWWDARHARKPATAAAAEGAAGAPAAATPLPR